MGTTMDPNETLAIIREACERGAGGAAIDAFRDLDNWLCRGGSLPIAWGTHARIPCPAHPGENNPPPSA